MTIPDPNNYPETARAAVLAPELTTLAAFLTWLREEKGLRLFRPRMGATPPQPWQGRNIELVTEWLGLDLAKLTTEQRELGEQIKTDTTWEDLDAAWRKAVAPLAYPAPR